MSSIFFITYYRVSYDHCRGTPPWSAICRWQPLHPVRIVQTQINRKICDTQQFDFIFTPSFNKGTAIRQPVPNQVNNFCSRGCKKSERNLYEKIQQANMGLSLAIQGPLWMSITIIILLTSCKKLFWIYLWAYYSKTRQSGQVTKSFFQNSHWNFAKNCHCWDSCLFQRRVNYSRNLSELQIIKIILKISLTNKNEFWT